MTAERPIRIIVVDDHPIVRDGFRALLGSLGGFDVVAEAADGVQAVAAVHTHRPDVVVMDLDLPLMSGVEATRRITAEIPGVGVLVVTMFDEDASLFAALRAGARGYILKESTPAQIAEAIAAVARGELQLGPSALRRVVDHVVPGEADEARQRPFPELSDREFQILERIALGENNRTIAARLGLNPKTVANNASNIFAKLHVADRSQAVLKATAAGLGRAAPPADGPAAAR